MTSNDGVWRRSSRREKRVRLSPLKEAIVTSTIIKEQDEHNRKDFPAVVLRWIVCTKSLDHLFDRVTTYLKTLVRWVETLKHPKRTMIVDVQIEMGR